MCFGKKKNKNNVELHQDDGESKKDDAKSINSDNSHVLGVFYFIAVIFTITMVFLVVWPLLHRISEINEIQITLAIPSDSIMSNSVINDNITQLNSIVEKINERNNIIDEKYNLFIKSRERDSDFFRLISVISAFIVALLGFLGYRTIKDIQDRVESSARDQAEKTSKQITEDVMSITVERKLNAMVSSSVASELIRAQIMEKINKEISAPLDARIEKQRETLELLSDRVDTLSNPQTSLQNKEDIKYDFNEGSTPSPEFNVPTNE